MEVLKECYLCYKSTSGHALLPPTHININWTTSPGTARATPTNLKNEKLCVCNTHNPKWICKKRIKPASDIIANSHYPSCTQRRVACLFPFFFTISAWKIIEEPEKRSLFCHKKYSVQLFSRVRLFATPWIAARQASLSITTSRSSLKLMSIESVMPSSHLILCRPFSSCPQYLPAWGSFPVSQLFARGGQSIGASASTSVLPMNIQNWSPLGWSGWISL